MKMNRLFSLGCTTLLVLSCAKELDEYYTPLGADAVAFSRNIAATETWYDQFNDTITTLALGERFFIENAQQHFEINTRVFFDSLYLKAEAFTRSESSNIFGTKQDLVEIRFMSSSNGNDLLRSTISLFPEYKDTVLDGGSSSFVTDSFSWNGIDFFRSIVLSSSLSSMEAVCDTSGNLMAFETIDGRIYRPINL